LKRREFLRASGAGLVLAATGPKRARANNSDGSYELPTRVTAILESGEIALHPAGARRWASGAIEVSFTEEVARLAGVTTPLMENLAVEIRAPGVALRAVILSWPMTAPDLVLNDHWERTYGDVAWQKPSPTRQLPWYFLASTRDAIFAFGVRTGGATLSSWQVGDNTRRLILDTCSGGVGVMLGTRALPAANIVYASSEHGESAFYFLRRFVHLMCLRPRLAPQPVYGINDWYFAYGRNSDALILQHTELMAPFAEGLENKPFSVIDAGWFEGPPSAPEDCCFGANMSTPNGRFKDMAALAASIRKRDMRPGLWTRPLCATDVMPSSLMLPRIAGREDPGRPILDPTIPENIDRVMRYFRLYREWKYDLVKIDFTTYDLLGKWGFEMLRDRELTARGWRMHEVGETNAEIIRKLYYTIRAAAGETLLIGCNTISHLSAGVFEINRIGDDTSGKEWDRTLKMGVNTLAFRGAQHGAFYAADADCVGLTPRVPWEKNRQWMDLVARSGTPLFISAQPESVGREQRPAIRAAFESAARALPLGDRLRGDSTEQPPHSPGDRKWGHSSFPSKRGRTSMKDPRVAEALAWLEAHSSKAVRDGMKRFAIPNDKALGVLMGNIQKLGKLLGRDHTLALELWKTDVYEARMLCAYVDEPGRVTLAQMDSQARDFDNWAICDTLCFALWVHTPHAFGKINKWAGHRDEFVKRAAFALLASVALKDKTAADADFLRTLPWIEKASRDERNFVKKAVNWALRGVGERNATLNKAAVVLAKKLAASREAAPRWIGKDALRQWNTDASKRRVTRKK
jgi:alpha-galactosidase